MFFSLGSPSSSFLLPVFHKSYLDSQSQLPYIPFSSQFLKISFLLLKIWFSLRSSIIFSYATPLTLLCAWLSQAFQQWTFWSSLSFLLHFLPVIFIILLLKKQRRGYYGLEANRQKSSGRRLVSIRFLDGFLGVSQALSCSMATAKGMIFLLESTHPLMFLVTFGIPHLRHRWESHLLAHLYPSRSTSWTSLSSVIFISCETSCVSSALPGELHLSNPLWHILRTPEQSFWNPCSSEHPYILRPLRSSM